MWLMPPLSTMKMQDLSAARRLPADTWASRAQSRCSRLNPKRLRPPTWRTCRRLKQSERPWGRGFLIIGPSLKKRGREQVLLRPTSDGPNSFQESSTAAEWLAPRTMRRRRGCQPITEGIWLPRMVRLAFPLPAAGTGYYWLTEIVRGSVVTNQRLGPGHF